jgi:hypothetical protein
VNNSSIRGTLTTAEAIGGAAKACLSCVGLISLFAMGACNSDNGLPAAQTPLNLSVEVPFVNAAGSKVWATVNPTASLGGTSYVVLPLIAPKVQVFFSAPYPSTFHMTA